MVKIKTQIAGTNSHYGGGNPATSITIHETDNWDEGANAQMHADYVNGDSPSSYHYAVDDVEAIKILSHDIRAWHAGDGKTSNGGNMTSISIEICVNRDGNYLKAVQNTIELVRKLMKQENISPNKVYQHNHWSGKNCPRSLRDGNKGINWNDFKQAIGNETVSIDSSNLNDLVVRTLNGEFGNGETRKKALGNDYQAVQDVINGNVSKSSGVTSQMVNDTLAGKYGNGEERKRNLGKHYDEVQSIINNGYSTKPKVNIDDLVSRTLYGEFGNGEERKRRLGKNYDEVQNIINSKY